MLKELKNRRIRGILKAWGDLGSRYGGMSKKQQLSADFRDISQKIDSLLRT
jgi:hypothetical protein